MNEQTHPGEAWVWRQKDFVKASYQHLRGAASACSTCSSLSLKLYLPCCWPSGNIPRPSHWPAGAWLSTVSQRSCSASKTTKFRQKKDKGAEALAGFRPVQRAKITHSMTQGTLRCLLRFLKGAWWSALPVWSAKCSHSTLNLASKPGIVRSKGQVSESSSFLSTIAGETVSLGPFYAVLVPREQGRAKLAPPRGARLQTSGLKDQIWKDIGFNYSSANQACFFGYTLPFVFTLSVAQICSILSFYPLRANWACWTWTEMLSRNQSEILTKQYSWG